MQVKPDDWAIAQFDARLAKKGIALGNIEYNDDNLEMVANLVKRTIIESMQDGLIKYCPAWSMMVAARGTKPFVQFNWDVALTTDWRDIDLPAVH